MKRMICTLIAAVGVLWQLVMAGGPPDLPLLPSDVSTTDPGRNFVMAMCADRAGNLWTANEDGGVWRMDPTAATGSQWTHFTTKDGLGDDYAYAVDCDNLGRIWVGHLNHGVSVFNGKTWQNYDVVAGVDSPGSLAGPLGDHVFGITVCRATGDVWMATNAGLTRYMEASHRWSYYTRRNRLASDQPNAIAFDQRGNIYVATQCDGVAMADVKDQYSNWRQTTGPDQILTNPAGDGLASNRINDILVARDGTVYAATPAGISLSTDAGKSWHYQRGQDWVDKVTNSVAGAPADFNPQNAGELLPEDFVSSLTEDPFGDIWLGFRDKGLMRMKRAGNALQTVAGNAGAGQRIKTLLPTFDGGRGLVGRYGSGIVPLVQFNHEPPCPAFSKPVVGDPPPLPTGALPPTLAELNSELAALAPIPRMDKTPAVAVPMEDDWRTRGDWLGRYGRYATILGGMVDGGEYQWGCSPELVGHFIGIGPHHTANDMDRYYVGEMYSSDPRVLEIPSIYMSSRVSNGLTTWDKNRRYAELNDDGTQYANTYEGPDLYTNIVVPEGSFILSYYFVNDDGHTGKKNCLRDYELIVKNLKYQNPGDENSLAGFDDQRVLARARVTDFWAGVYKRFMVQGPAMYSIRMNRQYGHNVVMSAFMLDQLDEKPAPYFTSFDDRNKAHDLRASALGPDAFRYTPATTEREAVGQLTDRMELMSDWNPVWWATYHRRIALLLTRWYQSPAGGATTKEDQARRATCFYRAGLYPLFEATQNAAGLKTARDVEKALRWDGVMPDSTGHGYELVTKYLAGQ